MLIFSFLFVPVAMIGITNSYTDAARDNDVDAIPKRVLVERNRRRGASSSAILRSSWRSVRATERGSLLPERTPARSPLVIVLVRPIADCIVSCLVGSSYQQALRETGYLAREAKCRKFYRMIDGSLIK